MLCPVSLLACPFCREMFQKDEHAKCPVCGVSLVAFEKLPASAEALADDGIPVEPEDELVPRTYLGRGRGPLVLLGLVGIAAFFLPWIEITLPDVVSLSGFSVARRLGWAWGAGVAWSVLVPTVLSRRTIRQMRGARVARRVPRGRARDHRRRAPGPRPPHGGHGVPLRFTFAPALYATLGLSVVAFIVAALFGGRPDDIRLRRGSSAGHLVH